MIRAALVILLQLAMAVAAAGLVIQPISVAGWPWLPTAMRAGAAGLLLLGAFALGRLRRRVRESCEALEADRFELAGLRQYAEGLERDCDLLRAEVERIGPVQALSQAAQAHDTLEGFIGTLARVVAHNLKGAKELTIYRSGDDTPEDLRPLAAYRLEHKAELLLAFTPEGGDLLAEQGGADGVPARRFGVRGVTVELQNTEFHVRADLGFTLPDRSKRSVGDAMLVLPRRHPEEELAKRDATERLKAEVAHVVLEPGLATEAVHHSNPQRYDGRRQRLDLACRLGTENEHFGVVCAGFDVEGVNVEEEARLWQPLLAEAARHIAQALRGHGYHVRAIKDGLTGLYNKSFMWEKLAEAFEEARANGADLSLVMADIDHFKSVNDTYGHPTGDIILKGVAEVLAGTARASDFAFRYGGEEMGFILSGQNARKALTLANRVRKKVEETEHVGTAGEVLSVTLSLGVAHLTPEMESAETLMSRADEALYHSKENGRNMASAWGPKKMSVRR
jgi:diguanylate cyclase (GGDEF)-like protein